MAALEKNKNSKMLMQYHWRTIRDPFGAGTFAVAPYTGHLVALNDEADKGMGRLLGFNPGRRRADTCFQFSSILDLPRHHAKSTSKVAQKMRRVVENSLKYLPLHLAISVVDGLYAARSSSAADIQGAIAETALMFGTRSDQDCLPVSLCRYLALKKMGVAASISIGVFIPTGKMHAWVEIDDHPCLECEDVLMHYQSCLKFGRSM